MSLLWSLINGLTVGNPLIEYMESRWIWEGLDESPVLVRRVATNVDDGGSQCKFVVTLRLKQRTAVMSVTGVGICMSAILA